MFRKAVKLPQVVLVRGRVVKKEGRKIFVRGSIEDKDGKWLVAFVILSLSANKVISQATCWVREMASGSKWAVTLAGVSCRSTAI
jgi:hypothetical protein